jgi:hypothetical protein
MMGNIKYWLVVSWFGTPRKLSAVLVQQIIECKSALYPPHYIKNGLGIAIFLYPYLYGILLPYTVYMPHVSPLYKQSMVG